MAGGQKAGRVEPPASRAAVMTKHLGRNLRASQLVRLIERRGGMFRIAGREVIPENVPACFDVALRAKAYLVKHIILDRAWTPERDLLPGGVEIPSLCTCAERDFSHVHADPGPEPTHKPRPGVDVFDALRRIVREAAETPANKPRYSCRAQRREAGE